MKVRMKVDVSGTYNGVPWPGSGGDIDVPDAIGAKLCANGQAEPVPVDDIETAVAAETVETAVAPPVPTRPAPGLTEKRPRGRPRTNPQPE